MMSDMKMGIEHPSSLERQMEIQGDVREIRKAISFGRHDSPVIARCLAMAEVEGLSSEETYALIAYFALLQVEELWKFSVKFSRLDIREPPFMRENDPGK